jgi:phage terminase small subunit
VAVSNAGRPRKPDNLKILHGDRPDRINRSAPQPGEAEIVPPFELSDEAQANWDRMAPDRIRQGVLTVWDVEAFAHFCEALVAARKAVPTDKAEGLKPGSATPLSEYKRAIDLLAVLGGRFGWTPSDRAKLMTGGGESDGKSADRLLS